LPEQAIAASVHGMPVPWHMRWASQILAYFELILSFSIFGHRFIACARMAGFNALRNTYRPLSATSLIEFFNRIYYYFKELLVDFFYYPAFLRYFKKHRRLRTIFATCSAVVFGDTFYHLTRDWHFFRDRGLWRGIASYQVEFVYIILLAIGLSVSQLRKRGPRPRGFLRAHLLPACGVAAFYIVVSVFETDTRSFSLAQTLRYFASLFFIHF
jgi:D-alanyl-lipoteichoic acid acyltransferase DltB (MBOAT superfamily)